ncbi:hypothetical protein [Rheinheimera sp.]|uniref:hypothetical protein n=1 Tax=Rheinheimera TaxID=67575 RepID=UPI0037C547B0|tara:strand:+ start:75 stop:473 length:399 start_codon:yes stop_codon:yes gene_type:complete
MDVIFDLEKESADWASELNNELQSSFPEFFAEHPHIGTSEWWASLSPDISKGKITHVGPMLEDSQLYDIVAIEPLDGDLNGAQPEFSLAREDYWLSDSVREGKYVQIESVTVLPTGELDEHSIYIETKVSVW